MELDNKFGFKVHLFCLLNRSVVQRVAQNDPEKSCRAGGKIVQKKTPDLSIKKKRCYIFIERLSVLCRPEIIIKSNECFQSANYNN